MGTLSDKLNYLMTTKEQLKQALVNNDVDIDDDTTFRNYASKTNENTALVGEELTAQENKLSTQEGKLGNIKTLIDDKFSLSFNLQRATSDATATTNDIAKNKTAYVNGVKLVGTSEGSVPDWSEIGYSETPYDIIDKFNFSKSIIENWDSSITNMDWKYSNNNNLIYFPLVDTSNVTSMQGTFYSCHSLLIVPLFDTSKVSNMFQMFYDTVLIKEIPQFNTSNVISMEYMFFRAFALENVPLFDTSKVNNMLHMFGGNSKLTNESLNNILQMCINSSVAITNMKTLSNIGLSQAQADTCETLSNWNAFVAAGWSSGY